MEDVPLAYSVGWLVMDEFEDVGMIIDRDSQWKSPGIQTPEDGGYLILNQYGTTVWLDRGYVEEICQVISRT
tara:strand:+ start:1896 stop:2111 length:216 start_codon:yes stop_codon:yes gene_type:complete